MRGQSTLLASLPISHEKVTRRPTQRVVPSVYWSSRLALPRLVRCKPLGKLSADGNLLLPILNHLPAVRFLHLGLGFVWERL